MRSAFAPMVVGVGPATALSWVCFAGLLAFNCVKGPVFPDGLSKSSGTDLSSTPLPGGERAAFSTTQVLTLSTRFLQSSLESEPATAAAASGTAWGFLPASLAQCVSWLAAGLVGVTVGRCSLRTSAPSAAAPVSARVAPQQSSPVKQAPQPQRLSAGQGGVCTPSTRRQFREQNGKVF